MKALYLEPDEEITSVVDRLKEIDDPEVAIVIPRRAGLLQSIINLKLLRHQGEQLKKKLSIVTTDKTGRNLASAVGLTVYQKLPDGNAVDEAAIKERPGAPVKITFRQKAGKTPSPQTETGPSISDIGFRPGKAPDIAKQPVPETPSPTPTPSPPETPKAAPSPAKDVAPPAPAKTQPPPVSPERPATKNKNWPSWRPSSLSLPTLKLPKSMGRFGGRAVLVAATVLLLGGGSAAAVVLPKAEITITPKTVPLQVDVSLTLSAKAPAVDPATGLVPAKVIDVTKESSKEVAATGKQDAGEKAKGEITIVNTLSKNQPLVTNTRFQAPDGRIFRIQSGVTVPAGDQVKVAAAADEGGEAGNLPAGTKLTIPGLGGTPAVYGQVETPLSGGTSTPGTQVSREDVERAKAELAQQAVAEGVAEAKTKLAVGYTLSEQTVATNVLSAKASPAAGTTATKFTITGRVKVSYFTYQDAEVQKLIKGAVQPRVPAGTDLVSESFGETFAVSGATTDKLSGVMKVSTLTALAVSRDQVKRDVAGKKPAEAEAALKQSGTASGVAIKLWPFWVSGVPKSVNKIDVRYSAQPQATPTSSLSISPQPKP